MAAENLLVHAHGVRAGAVRITDGIGFDWRRWMENLVQGRELRGPGVAEAYVVRRFLEPDPEYVFVRTDGETVSMNPTSQTHALQYRRHVINYITEQGDAIRMLLRDAPVAVHQWQHVRRQPPQHQ